MQRRLASLGERKPISRKQEIDWKSQREQAKDHSDYLSRNNSHNVLMNEDSDSQPPSLEVKRKSFQVKRGPRLYELMAKKAIEIKRSEEQRINEILK